MSLKITSIIIINTFLLLSSCAIDWNDEKAKSIENLKQDLVTLQGQSHKTEELNKLELQDRCSKKSKEFFHDHYSNIKVS